MSMEPDFNIDNAAADIAADLGFGSNEPTETPVDDPVDHTPDLQTEAPVVEAPVTRAPPKSWAKDYHEHWGKLDPAIQEYVEKREKQMLDGLDQYKTHNEFGAKLRPVFEPYRDFLQQNNLDEVKATQYLLAAQHRLATGDMETRRSMLQQLAQSYGIDLAGAPQSQQQGSQYDPQITPLLQKVNNLESVLQRTAEYQQKQTLEKVSGEVNAFASDPANEYFDECAEDITQLIRLGMDLPQAYQKAVWANPVTREKLIEKEATLRLEAAKAKAKEEAERAQKASRGNVRSRESSKAPTEPLGSWQDGLKTTLDEIKSRPN